MEETLLTTPFMLAALDKRDHELAGHYPGFKTTVTKLCRNVKAKLHEVHLALVSVEEEILFHLEEATDIAKRYLRRALLLMRKMLEHIKLRIKHAEPFSKAEQERENNAIRKLVSSGRLKKVDVVMIGHAIHEMAFKGTDTTIVEICVGLGDFFGMSITEAYVRSAYTDIRNQYEKNPDKLFITTLAQIFVAKLDRSLSDADERYERGLQKERLAKMKR